MKNRSSLIHSLINFSYLNKIILLGGTVLRIPKAYAAFLTSLCLFCISWATAEENLPSQIEPQIHTRFFSGDAIQVLPKLKHLNAQDPWYNKILFKVEGFPIQQNLIMEIKRLASSNPDQFYPILNFSIQEDGTYLLNNKDTLKTIVSSSRGFLPGERVTYRIRTTDHSVEKEVSRIPTPVIFEDKQGKIVLRAELLSLSPTVYLIEFPTMNEGEEFDLKASSIGEIVKAKPRFSSSKPFHFSPAAKGMSKGGESLLEIHRKSGETYYLKLPWGTALDAYLKGERAYLSSN